MNKMLQICVNSSNHTVVSENGVPSLDFRYWKERLKELEKDGWFVVDVKNDFDKNICIYQLQKNEEEIWEYCSKSTSISSPAEQILNKYGADGWELVSSVYIDMPGFVLHIMKRRLKK